MHGDDNNHNIKKKKWNAKEKGKMQEKIKCMKMIINIT